MTNNEITVKVEHVTKTFGDFTAVQDLSMTVGNVESLFCGQFCVEVVTQSNGRSRFPAAL